MDELYQRSIEIILENQADRGAYVARPSFPPYRYCWFRGGSYIACSVDLASQHDSSRSILYCARNRHILIVDEPHI